LQPSLAPDWGAVGSKLENSDFIAYMKSSQFAVVILITFCATLAKLRCGSNQPVESTICPRCDLVATSMHTGIRLFALVTQLDKVLVQHRYGQA
jgi:hypothetical protein